VSASTEYEGHTVSLKTHTPTLTFNLKVSIYNLDLLTRLLASAAIEKQGLESFKIMTSGINGKT